MNTPSKTTNDETNDTLHSMVENNLLKIVKTATRRYQIYKGSSARPVSATWELHAGSDRNGRSTLRRGLSCGPLITGVTREDNFRGGGLL